MRVAVLRVLLRSYTRLGGGGRKEGKRACLWGCGRGVGEAARGGRLHQLPNLADTCVAQLEGLHLEEPPGRAGEGWGKEIRARWRLEEDHGQTARTQHWAADTRNAGEPHSCLGAKQLLSSVARKQAHTAVDRTHANSNAFHKLHLTPAPACTPDHCSFSSLVKSATSSSKRSAAMTWLPACVATGHPACST